jgi:cytochrome c oxidase cbb3-type subunit 3
MKKRVLTFVCIISSLAVFAACKSQHAAQKRDPLLEAYGVEKDWNNPDRLIPLNYQQAQGKRIFYEKCVWCHSDTSPAGPSNRMNVQPTPPLINDGKIFNSLSDEYLENVITLGGAAMGKSAIMPPWGRTLSQDDIKALVVYIRAVAEPPYQRPAQPGPKYSAR